MAATYQNSDGSFQRPEVTFRDQVTPGGKFEPESAPPSAADPVAHSRQYRLAEALKEDWTLLLYI